MTQNDKNAPACEPVVNPEGSRGTAQWPRAAMLRALKILQADNFRALKEGEGRGNSNERMAEILDQESGFSKLVESLNWRYQQADERARMLESALKEFAQLDAALTCTLPSVMGLLCICDTPQLHDEGCVTLRKAVDKMRYVVARALSGAAALAKARGENL